MNIFTLAILIALQIIFTKGSGTVFDATEGKAMSSEYDPVRTTNSRSQIGCFMKVIFKNHPCHVLEVKETSPDKWTCRIFSTTDNRRDLKMVDHWKATVYTTRTRAEECKPAAPAASCLELYKNGVIADGVYEIAVNGKVVSVFCDMTTEGGGWTVFQKRVDGSVDFYRRWNDYVQGFGDPATNYWLGLELIHQMTKRDSPTSFLAIGEKGDGTVREIIQSDFSIGDESTNYRLHAGVNIHAVNSVKNEFHKIDGMDFSTRDRDNDKTGGSCATSHKSGWWYNSCYYKFHANGIYGLKTTSGIQWDGSNNIEKSIAMAIRKQN